jgi:hypothetical protein
MHSWFTDGEIWGNWATDHAIVQACSGHDVCVTLFAPTGTQCSVSLFDFVIPLLAHYRVLGRGDLRAAEDAMRAVFESAPRSAFELEQEPWLRMAFEQTKKQGTDEGPKRG